MKSAAFDHSQLQPANHSHPRYQSSGSSSSRKKQDTQVLPTTETKHTNTERESRNADLESLGQ